VRASLTPDLQSLIPYPQSLPMRHCYLVCYDICNAKRLYRVHKLMKGYGEPWQYSIFFCILKSIDRVRMQTDLEEQIDHKKDQILIIDLGENPDSARHAATVLGQPLGDMDKGIVVV
jgi:CRISPR-associated protein Cas2